MQVQRILERFTLALKVLDVFNKRQTYVSVITGKENASVDWNCITLYFLALSALIQDH